MKQTFKGPTFVPHMSRNEGGIPSLGALLAWTGRLLFFWEFSTAREALMGRGSIRGGVLWTGGEGDEDAGFVSPSPVAGAAASLLSVRRRLKA